MQEDSTTWRHRVSAEVPSWARHGVRAIRRQVPAWRRVIVYDKLGSEGRLGNQLWQIAGTLGLAERHNADAAFNAWPYAEQFSVPDRYFPKTELVGHRAWTVPTRIAEPFRVFLQDASLWMNIEARIRRYFSPNPSLEIALQRKFSEILSLPNKTSMHVRRTDYIAHPEAFSVLSTEYYRKALEQIGDSNLLVFSDDPAWCRENLGFARPAAIVEGNRDYEDFFLMTQCQNHVTANSSFSWWGAFLSGDPHPVVPKLWYGHEFYAGGIDESLMFLDGWIVVDA
jgi:hypothetical protein